jgi:hypothetical protein
LLTIKRKAGTFSNHLVSHHGVNLKTLVKRARVEEGAKGIISIWYSRTTGPIRSSLGRKNKYTNKHAFMIFLLAKI